MKITAVRLIENKDPVGVFGGWMSDSSLDLNLIRECMNPPECEFLETEISEKIFGVMWPRVRQEGEDLPSKMKFTLGLNLYILEIFTVGYFLWERFSDHKKQDSDENMDNRIEKLNNEIDYLNEKILEKGTSLECSDSITTKSIMFMFASWAVSFVSIALLILK